MFQNNMGSSTSSKTGYVKKRGLFIIPFVLLNSFPLLFSQDFPDSSYYPLGMGYQWNYSNDYFPHAETVVDTITVNGLLYYGLAIWVEQAEYWFREDNGIVYLLDTKDSSHFPLFDFNADTGESWELPLGYECSFGTRITLTSKEDTVITPADTFFSCYHFEHEPSCVDAGMYDTWFAKGVGKVRYLEDNIAGMMDYLLSSYSIVSLMSPEGQSLTNYSYQLGQNYPNPFNPTTTIEFSIPLSGRVTLAVHDLLGREIDTILNQHMDAGHHKVQWNAENVPSGIYFVRMEAGDFRQVRKVTLLK